MKKKSVNEVFEQNAKMQSETTEKIKEHLSYWIPRLQLSYWQMTSSYSTLLNERFPEAAAHVNYKDEYATAHLTWHLPALMPLEPDTLEEVVIHELCHLVVAPLDRKKPKPRKLEIVVTNLSRILLNMKQQSTKKSGL